MGAPSGKYRRDDLGVERHVGGAIADALVQIGRDPETAGGMANGRFHHVGAGEGAETFQRLTPAHQVAGRGDRGGAEGVLAADGVHVARRGARVGRVGRGIGRQRRHALVVDHDVAAVGQPDVRHAAAEHAGIIGSTTDSVKNAAMAASMALPPAASISAAAAEANGWLVTAMPRRAVAGVFLGLERGAGAVAQEEDGMVSGLVVSGPEHRAGRWEWEGGMTGRGAARRVWSDWLLARYSVDADMGSPC